MLRRTARLAAWVSLALFVASCVLMVGSAWRVSWTTSSLHRLELYGGNLQVLWRGSGGRFNGVSPGWRVGAAPGPLNFSAVGWMRDGDRDWWVCRAHWLLTGTPPNFASGTLVMAVATIRLWTVAVASALLGAGLFAVSRKRKPPGQCAACGYDLASLPMGAKCPECGMIAACPPCVPCSPAPARSA